MWNVNILTFFPEIFPGPLEYSVVGNALKRGIWQINCANIRNYGEGIHKSVDEVPYGGGGGMVMRPDVAGRAIEDFFLENKNPIIYPSPRGKLFNQSMAKAFSRHNGINILCGRFEGIDERILKEYRISEVSIGDFVLSSGDIAAFSIIDSCIGLLNGVFAESEKTLAQESFDITGEVLLEYPHYTKPRMWKNLEVPEVLLSGNHGLIHTWRMQEAQNITKKVRPDLYSAFKSINKNKK
ncbi:MAG: tRNA (guanosine(37)-N1)-methyltransferase TrmD [Proteobacteria bacterium]|nr:tRNA (guanosine(37)-N1)-methyltransferase TrmD [Pseudomonadota bacterium]